MSYFYFVFWFFITLVLTILAAISHFYLFSLLKDIRRSLRRIETILSAKETAGKRRK